MNNNMNNDYEVIELTPEVLAELFDTPARRKERQIVEKIKQKEQDELQKELDEGYTITINFFSSDKDIEIKHMEFEIRRVPKKFAKSYLTRYECEFIEIGKKYAYGYLKKIGFSYPERAVYIEDYDNADLMNEYIEETIKDYKVEFRKLDAKYKIYYETADYNAYTSALEKHLRRIAKECLKYVKEYNICDVKFKSRAAKIREMRRLAEEWEKKSSVEKAAIKFANRKTAPTLASGWITYIIVMCVGFIFRECVAWWVGISIIFWAWRHGEINKYN